MLERDTGRIALADCEYRIRRWPMGLSQWLGQPLKAQVSMMHSRTPIAFGNWARRFASDVAFNCR